MKQNVKLYNLKRIIQVLSIAFSLICFLFILISCSIYFGDRTTVIYGKVTDQNKEAVDSILVEASGLWALYNLQNIKQTYTDENGNYEMVIEVPRKYNSLDIGIPYDMIANSKFQNNYSHDIVWKNGKQTYNCCIASIGEKTEYNFQLKPNK
ncbi:hypothetical protein [Dyadobacter sediminis]|uniref:Uncharacterized protein n=2 Tax=Dyadobacter sediminis TaxID=1493691 RepID=A0A5R9K8H2_9BACT|nr:hypothetical protein [Dyadobacter sediminis]TLU90300.1 hypothetical protein FEM55_17175 [Dyadobacter sediminis]GGC06666.1 hypothetical protein GCM10011325_36870 [Dyadobacter sediminis]